MDRISSRSNQQRSNKCAPCASAKTRQETGLFFVEGIWHVGEAAEAVKGGDFSFHSVYFAPDLLKSEFASDLVEKLAQTSVPCFPVSPQVFTSIAEKENPQGILAVLSARSQELAELTPGNFPRGVALVSPQDPGNVGAILRTIDAVGASGLLLLDSSVDLYHPGVVRASMGALFWHPVVSVPFEAFAGWAQASGYHVYGTSAHGDEDYRQIDYQEPHILLLGSERAGLTPHQAAVCQHMLRMPMLGRVTSLNLAVAAGILLYEILGNHQHG